MIKRKKEREKEVKECCATDAIIRVVGFTKETMVESSRLNAPKK